MLNASPGAPRRTPAPAWRLPVALIGLAVALLAIVLFLSRRGRPEPPAASSASARARQEDRPAPRSSRADRAAPDARRDPPRPASRASAEPPDAAALRPDDVSDPALKAVLAARDDPSPAGTRTLIDGLTSRDAIVVAEAAKALVVRQATEAIAPLAKIGLEKAAGSGLSVIDALGKLAGVAEGEERDAAVERLLEMLRDEKRRNAPETPGNLLQIYEALGDTRDPRAAPPLEAELLDAKVARAPKVVIVQALVEIGAPSSKDALAEAQRTQSAERGEDDFEEEIRRELLSKIAEALEAL